MLKGYPKKVDFLDLGVNLCLCGVTSVAKQRQPKVLRWE